MVALRIGAFAGTVPRRDPRLLEQSQAQVAANCRLTSGYMEVLREPKLVNTPGVTGIATIFRMFDTAAEYWLAWDRDVDAAKGPIAGDSTFRTYFTGDGEPRVTNISLATSGTPYPKSCYVLGVYPPANAPSLSAAGGVAATTVSRSFKYTFVTQWGEESQPSPASSVLTAKTDDTWTVSGMDVAPLNSWATTAGTWAAGIATLTVASTFGLRVGEEINVASVTPSGFNATRKTITGLTATTVSYAVTTNPGAYAGAGTVSRVAPHNTSSMTKRIYWTETLADGTHWRLVKEVAVATTSTTVAGGTASTAESASDNWVMPPVDMKGLCMMANGIAVGFRGNEILFSPAFVPYAYPTAYRLTTDFEIVGIGAVGAMVVIGTKGSPYVVSGVDPAGMTMTKVDRPWPCMAKRSIVAIAGGVAYAAPQGLAVIGPQGADMVTIDMYTQEEWSALALSTFNAAQFSHRYIAAYDFASNSRQALIVDRVDAASVVNVNANVQAFYGDAATGKLYAVIDDAIWEWDADPGNRMLADWMSREFVFPKPVNLGAAKVDADFTMSSDDISAAQAAADAAKAANAVLIAAKSSKGSLNATSFNGMSFNGSLVRTPPSVSWESLTFQLYINGGLKYSRTITDSRAFKMPGGYKADTAAFRVSGNIPVKAIVAAETMSGLAGA